jgi:hypothetical protein
MKPTTILAVSALLFAAAYGCHSSSDDDSGATQDKLVGFAGSVDHAGVVESGTILLTTANNPLLDSSLDAYNQEDPFQVKSTVYRDAFAKNLLKFDKSDGKTDWTPEQSTKWLARIASNYQVIDTSLPCNYDDPHTYLEIERAQLTGKDHATCGGRTPNEDALDVTFNFLAGGPNASLTDDGAMGDGIEQATKKSTDTFPYLAELND